MIVLNAIEVIDLNKSFEGFKLDNVSIKVPKGLITGLVGENGAGKTTLINLITGSLEPDSGEILIDGKKADKRKEEVLEKLYLVMDEPLLIDDFFPRDYNTMMKGIYKKWSSQDFFHYVKLFDLPLEKKVGNYSRGMKVKFNFALALATNPELLILDEATSGLDPLMRDDILEILTDYVQNKDHTVLFSSHIVSDLDKIADKIIFIHKGKVMLEEDKKNILCNYGIVRCTTSDFHDIDPAYIISYRKMNYKINVLVKDIEKVQNTYPKLLIENPDIEDIILLIGKGETQCKG